MRPEVTTIVLGVLTLILAGMVQVLVPQEVRVIPGLAFPVLAGWFVHVFYQE
jgi:hypothetical protein